MPIRSAALAATAAAALAITLGAAALALSIAPAHAAVYQLENPIYPVGVDYAAHASSDPAIYLGATPFTLTISDVAVARGHFDYDAGWAKPTTGDGADFVSFRSYDYGPGTEDLRINLRFDAAGNASGSLHYQTDLVELGLSGNANDFGGLFILGANSSYRGHFSGQLVDPSNVPEASTLGLIVTALSTLAIGKTLRRVVRG